jgi:hypothetical protein
MLYGIWLVVCVIALPVRAPRRRAGGCRRPGTRHPWGTWGENLGYYGTVLTRELRARRARNGRLTPAAVLRTIRNLALEFGGAELLDSLLIRPAASSPRSA